MDSVPEKIIFFQEASESFFKWKKTSRVCYNLNIETKKGAIP